MVQCKHRFVHLWVQILRGYFGIRYRKYFYKYERTNSVVQTSSETPDDFELNQNYPNPFNPSTKINYRLQVAGVTRLVVIDLMGRESLSW